MTERLALPIGPDVERVILKPKFSETTVVGDVEVRRGSAEDAPGCFQLFNGHLEWINSWFTKDQVVRRATTHERIDSLMQQAPAVVAEANGKTVGFATTQMREPDVLSIANVYVDDAYRNHGVGTQILRLLELLAISYDCKSIISTASDLYFPGKPSPRTLFARLGYDIIGISAHSELYLKRLDG